MRKIFSGRTMCVWVGTIGLFSLGFCSGTATVQNAGFETFFAASDSFAYWKIDTAGKSKFTVTQVTDSVHSGTGCLIMKITDTTDATVTARISTSIIGLQPNKLFTITAWVKYVDMPAYWNCMFNVQQATLTPGTWVWTDRNWLTPWGNNMGSSDWTQVFSRTDTTADSANVFNLIISLSKGGTIWIDDIAITYTDINAGTKFSSGEIAHDGIRNNRISFSHEMPYSLEAFSMDGKALIHRSGIASSIDLNRRDITNGVYLMKVKTPEMTYSSRVVISK